MSLYKYKISLEAQIAQVRKVYESVKKDFFMSENWRTKLEELENELKELPEQLHEPRIEMLFSGKAVYGSTGIKSSFVAKTVKPFQEMVKTQAALVRFGSVGKRGRAKKGATTDLYLTALPVGSFGVELSQLETVDLFDSDDVSNAIKQVVKIIQSSAADDETFERTISNVPKRNLTNLKKLLEEIAENNSILKLETNEIGIQITEEKVKEAYLRVSQTADLETEIVLDGIFRGILLDSGRFEVVDIEGRKISGFISQDLTEEELISYDQNFFNEKCQITLKEHRTTFKTGNEKVEYELLEIKASSQQNL